MRNNSLDGLRGSNTTLFYRLLIDHLNELTVSFALFLERGVFIWGFLDEHSLSSIRPLLVLRVRIGVTSLPTRRMRFTST